MKVYLAAALVKRRNLRLANMLSRIIAAQGHEILSPWILDKRPDWGLSSAGVFKRDLEALQRSDLLVGELSVPSHGVGMEIMAAHSWGKPILLLYSDDTKVSALIRGMPRAVVRSYGSPKELESVIQRELMVVGAKLNERRCNE